MQRSAVNSCFVPSFHFRNGFSHIHAKFLELHAKLLRVAATARDARFVLNWSEIQSSKRTRDVISKIACLDL